ncbi:MAG: sigma-70 family RNA polymerase sigma factor [Tissierellia bacterium]|nr:sigma-70 family RNA polymerase sigma factor [Tissierellia bacterium]
MNSFLFLYNSIEYDDKYDVCSDIELVEKINQGNDQAEKCLFKRYFYLIRKIISSFYIMGCGKDDVFQESMIGLLKAIKRYDKKYNKSFKRYAELCIRRQIISALRKFKKYEIPTNCFTVSYSENEFLEQVSDDSPNPEDLLIVKEEKDIFVEFASSHLSDYEKSVINKYCQGKSYKEIAEALNKDLKSVDNALQRVKKKARLCFLENTE